MLRTISLANFKCFSHLRLDLAPMTLLCGVNGMGKSSVLQALLVLRQSFRAGELGKEICRPWPADCGIWTMPSATGVPPAQQFRTGRRR